MKTCVAVLSILVLVTFIGINVSSTTETINFKSEEPPSAFRLFETQNMWNFLLLDTRNGRVWQVQYSVKNDIPAAYYPINEAKLPVPNRTGERLGRFTLYPTQNAWNFILLDQDEGHVYQCQYSSAGRESRFVRPIAYGGYKIRSHNEIRTPLDR